MRKLSITELNRIDIKTFKESQKTPLVVILDNVRSALNVGSAFRTADAFILQELALCGITAKPPHREILKTAIGATHSMSWKHFEQTAEAIEHYRGLGYKIWSIEQVEGSTPLQEFVYQEGEKIAVIFGNEVQGVSQEAVDLSDGCLEIPQFGTKHSLNISVCLGIVVWELFKGMRRS